MKPRLSDFKTWFDNPETELRNFLNSSQAIMNISFGSGRVVELSKRDAAHLLEELQNEKDNEE